MWLAYGRARYQNGAYHEAAVSYREALELRNDDGISLNNLAMALASAGDYAEAEPLLQRALAISEKVRDPEHPLTATSLNNLGTLYRDQGRYAQAVPLLQRALAIFEKVLGPEHPDTATSLSNLAGLYRAQRRYAEAEPLFQRALAIFEKGATPRPSRSSSACWVPSIP